MGPLLERIARRLNTPAVRSADTGADWCGPAAGFSAELAAAPADREPFAITPADPLAYAAQAMAALVAGRDILLANPQWTTAERAAAEAIRTAPPPPGTACGPRILIATGGSSGQLRFATHTPDTLSAAAAALQQYHRGEALNSLCVLPLHHISGFQQLVRALATDGELLLADWRAMAAGALPPRPTAPGRWILSLVPTQLQRLLEHDSAAPWLRSFDTILLGGAPAGAALLDRARTGRLPISIAYGSSETAAVFALEPAADFHVGRSGLVPLPHAKLRILDPDTGCASPPGTLGRVEVEAASLFLGYWPEPRAAGPWLTDDLGRLDHDGRLQLFGRCDAAINTGGEKVHPAEVEAALRELGVFTEIVVLGVPDPRWGECVAALFPAGDRPDLGAVEAALRTRLGAHKLPRRWFPVENWPSTTQGKTDRAALRRFANL